MNDPRCTWCGERLDLSPAIICPDCTSDAREGLALREAARRARKRYLRQGGLLQDAEDALEPFARADRLSASTDHGDGPRVEPQQFVSVEHFRDAAALYARLTNDEGPDTKQLADDYQSVVVDLGVMIDKLCAAEDVLRCCRNRYETIKETNPEICLDEDIALIDKVLPRLGAREC